MLPRDSHAHRQRREHNPQTRSSSSLRRRLWLDISFPETGGDPHKKAVLIIRQSLSADSAYADVALHGDGLTSLQARDANGAATHEIQSNVTGPKRVRIQKVGQYFYIYVGAASDTVRFAGGSMRVKLEEPFYVGIGARMLPPPGTAKVDLVIGAQGQLRRPSEQRDRDHHRRVHRSPGGACLQRVEAPLDAGWHVAILQRQRTTAEDRSEWRRCTAHRYRFRQPHQLRSQYFSRWNNARHHRSITGRSPIHHLYASHRRRPAHAHHASVAVVRTWLVAGR